MCVLVEKSEDLVSVLLQQLDRPVSELVLLFTKLLERTGWATKVKCEE